MNKILQRVILFAVAISIAMMAAAATVPNVLSQLPYTYGLGNFPAYQINQNEAYILDRLEPSAVATAATAGGEVECTWLNSTIGYNCNAR